MGKWSMFHIRSDQSLSSVQLFATPWIAARQASLSITNSWSSLRLTSIESVVPSSHVILCRPLLLLPLIPPSIRVFSNESTLCMRWQSTGVSALASFLPKKSQGWSPSNGLFGCPCSPRDSQESSPRPQFKSTNSLGSTFFTVQLSHPYMTTGKTIALTRQTFSLSNKICHCNIKKYQVSLLDQMVRDLPAVKETWIWFLGQDDSLEKGMVTHSSILAWKIPWTEESFGLSVVSKRVRHEWAINTFTFHNIKAPEYMGVRFKAHFQGNFDTWSVFTPLTNVREPFTVVSLSPDQVHRKDEALSIVLPPPICSPVS